MPILSSFALAATFTLHDRYQADLSPFERIFTVVRPTRRAVRVVFVTTLLWIALVQYVPFAVWHHEPYPALFLPGFPAQCPGCPLETGVPTSTVASLVVVFADGHTQGIPVETLLPPGPQVRLMTLFSAFDDRAGTMNPEAVDWLRSRITDLFPDGDAVEADIVWRKATYRAADPSHTEYAPMHTTRISLGSSA